MTIILDTLLYKTTSFIPYVPNNSQNEKQLEKLAVKLLDNGAIPEPNGYMPLAEAVKYGYTDLVKALIRNGFTFEVNYKHLLGRTWLLHSNRWYTAEGNLLDIANFNKQTEIAEILKKEFPDLEAEISDYSKLRNLIPV